MLYQFTHSRATVQLASKTKSDKALDGVLKM